MHGAFDDSTNWSNIQGLKTGDANAAWEWFIRRYSAFVTAVLCRRVLPVDVERATADFWGYLFRSRAIDRADRRGRFRSFLSGILANYASAWRRENAPGAPMVQADQLAVPSSTVETEELELWAAQILHLALERLSRQHPMDAQALRLFYGLPEQPGAAPGRRLAATAIAGQLQCTANAMHQTLFRARARLHDCIVTEVGATIASTRDLRDELMLLTACIGRHSPGIVESHGDDSAS